MSLESPATVMVARYRRRASWWYRLFRPPLPLISNPAEAGLPQNESVSLLVGGAGAPARAGFFLLDIVQYPGIDVQADAERLPFVDACFGRIECDAVLEHVPRPTKVVDELFRVMKPGASLHVVVPFCHPYHGYPNDFHRWTVEGLRELLSQFDAVEFGVRTGPTAALLTFFLDYVKLLTPAFPRGAYAAVGWIVWPLRYLDRILLKRPESHVLANSIYALVRKPLSTPHQPDVG